MSLIRLEGVVREVGTFVILDQVTAAIAPGERVGLVGPNGAGKTTLLRIAAGQDEPDRGTATRKRGLSLGLLGQEAHFDEAFMAAPDLRSAVRHGAAHLERMAEELGRLEHDGHAAGTHYADLQHRFEILGGYTLDQRVDEALSGLGFARDEWTRPPTAISGGQQTRAALARLVIADPDLLLLDEPTNHLDIGAIEWLEEHLRRRAGALLVASHDRAFLDATVSRVWELRDRRLTVFRGDYSLVPPPARRTGRPRGARGRVARGRDRARDRAGPALPEPAQAREDARARGQARAAARAAGRDAEGGQGPQAARQRPRRRPGAFRRARDPPRGPRGRLPPGPRRARPGRLRGRRAR